MSSVEEEETPDGGEVVQGEETPDVEIDDDADAPKGTDGCCVPEDDMLAVRDLNLDYPWKGGNQYARICPDCGSRTFTSKAYWQMAQPQHVIPRGGKKPKVLYDCPYEECDGTIYEGEEACEDCEGEIDWVDE